MQRLRGRAGPGGFAEARSPKALKLGEEFGLFLRVKWTPGTGWGRRSHDLTF